MAASLLPSQALQTQATAGTRSRPSSHGQGVKLRAAVAVTRSRPTSVGTRSIISVAESIGSGVACRRCAAAVHLSDHAETAVPHPHYVSQYREILGGLQSEIERLHRMNAGNVHTLSLHH